MGAFLSAQPAFPTVDPSSATADTNREEQLRQAVRRAIEGKTNADATPSAPAVVPALPALAPSASQAPPVAAAVPTPGAPVTEPTPAAPAAPQPALPGPPSPGRPGAVVDPNAAAPPGPAAPGQPALPGTPLSPRSAAPGDQVAATASTTNAPPEEMIPQGMIDFRGADLNQVLQVYADLVNRTILRPGTLAAANQITLTTRGTLTRKEGIQALEAVL